MIEIKPYGFEENGRKFYVECYPYINNKPVPAIAHCRHCSLCNPDENEICFGWQDNPEQAPLFCGPVCPKFDLVSSKLDMHVAETNKVRRQASVLQLCRTR
ncbi:MAG: hypothetical protein M8357_16495, partial [Desulfobulbaceae bacterium]|nr:hypothetical protein [Desulfobulbaceae bacterium]